MRAKTKNHFLVFVHKENLHHGGTEDAEEFFAFREMPKGENSLISI